MVALLMCEPCRNKDHEHCEKGEGSLPGMIGGGWICTCSCRHPGFFDKDQVRFRKWAKDMKESLDDCAGEKTGEEV